MRFHALRSEADAEGRRAEYLRANWHSLDPGLQQAEHDRHVALQASIAASVAAKSPGAQSQINDWRANASLWVEQRAMQARVRFNHISPDSY